MWDTYWPRPLIWLGCGNMGSSVQSENHGSGCDSCRFDEAKALVAYSVAIELSESEAGVWCPFCVNVPASVLS